MVALFHSMLFRSVIFSIPLFAVILITSKYQKKFRAAGIYYLWSIIAICMLVPSISLIHINTVHVSFPGILHINGESERKEEIETGNIDIEKTDTKTEFSKKETVSDLQKNNVKSEKNLENGGKANHTKTEISKPVTVQKENKPSNVNHIFLSLGLKYISLVGAVVWLLGMAVYFLYTGICYLSVKRKLFRWSRQSSKEEKKILEKMKHQLGIHTSFRLLHSEYAMSPMLIGLKNPTILLPMKTYEPKDFAFILKHELVHYKHHDIVKKCVFHVIRGVYWFHPLVHIMYQKVNFCMELYCDETVIKAQDEAFCQNYSLVLLDALRNQSSNGYIPLTTYLNGGKKQMKERFKHIMSQGKKTRGTMLFACLAILCMMVTTVSCGTKNTITEKNVASKVQNEGSDSKILANNKINLLLAGVDNIHDEGNGRADAIVLLTVDQEQKTITATDMVRDLYVDIEGHDKNKLNAAYAYGGAKLLESTVEKNLNIDISGTVSVGFDQMEKIIDDLGGIDLTITKKEADYLNKTNYISRKSCRNLVKGTQTLNGTQALGYARVRKVETEEHKNDAFGRGYRFGKILKAILKKGTSISITDAISLVSKYGNQLSEDLSIDDMIALAKCAMDKDFKLQFQQIPMEGDTYTACSEKCGCVIEMDLSTSNALKAIGVSTSKEDKLLDEDKTANEDTSSINKYEAVDEAQSENADSVVLREIPADGLVDEAQYERVQSNEPDEIPGRMNVNIMDAD